jgi:hypothetical protein
MPPAASSNPKVEFREWLVRRVMDMAFQVHPDESVDTLTKRLGIRPDVLVEAQKRKLEELRSLGRQGKNIGARRRVIDGRAAIFMNIGKPIHEDLMELCRLRKIDLANMVRAALNTLLLGPRNPRNILIKGCWYKGERCKVEHSKKKRWPYVVYTTVSHGAKIALQRRADALGTTVTALIRCQLVDLLEGHVPKLYYVNPGSMFGDPDKYWTTMELMKKEMK